MEILLAIGGSVFLCLLMLLGFYAAKDQERERCARIAERYAKRYMNLSAGILAGQIAVEIRAKNSDEK